MSEAARRGTVEVRKATAADVPGMARALGRAFYDDPVMAWMMPEERRRRRLESLGFVQWLKRIYMPKGEVYTDGALAGGALWAPPGKWRMPIRLQARMGPMFIRLVGARRTPLILKGLAALPRKGRISAICSSKSRTRLQFTLTKAPFPGESVSTSSAILSWFRREVAP